MKYLTVQEIQCQGPALRGAPRTLMDARLGLEEAHTAVTDPP
jgi:hypothetical protein